MKNNIEKIRKYKDILILKWNRIKSYTSDNFTKIAKSSGIEIQKMIESGKYNNFNRIDYDSLKSITILGSGAFGEVQEVIDYDTLEFWALKKFKPGTRYIFKFCIFYCK